MKQKSILEKLNTFLFDPFKRTVFLSQHGFYRNMSDEQFLKMQFKNVHGYEPDLKNPKTFNEKLQWMKLYDRKELYTTMVDKLAVKKYVSSLIGEEYVIPLLGVWDSFDEIDFDALPDQFVLKVSHDSGGLVVCTDQSKLDKRAARKKIERSLHTDYYMVHREWPYKNVPRKIIAEKYMADESGYELKDYKFFCFDGEVKALYVASDRTSETEETKCDFFDTDFNRLPLVNGHPNSNKPVQKPKGLDKMKELAAQLSKGFPELRIDFYDVDGKIYFGEFTFFHYSGFEKFHPEEWDNVFGDWIKLPLKTE